MSAASDTPRTDAGAFWVTSPTDPEMREEVVVSHFARQLERGLSAAPAAETTATVAPHSKEKS